MSTRRLLAVALGVATLVIGALAPHRQALADTPPSNAGPCGPNLIKNGSFEAGTNPGSYLTIKMGSDDLTDWTVSKGTVDIVGTLWPASDGKRSIDMDGTSFGAISQDIATDPGKTYSVTFDMAGNGYGPPTVKQLQLSAAGSSEHYSFDMAKRPYPAMGWQTHSWRFVAKDKSTTIRFDSLDTVNGYFGPVLDNVTVQLVCNS
jgi:choice-of-anchor C domain-containing protein